MCWAGLSPGTIHHGSPAPHWHGGLRSSGGCTYERPKHTAPSPPAILSSIHRRHLREGGGVWWGQAFPKPPHRLDILCPQPPYEGTSILSPSCTRDSERAGALPVATQLPEGPCRRCALSPAGSDVPAPTHAVQDHAVPPLCPHQSQAGHTGSRTTGTQPARKQTGLPLGSQPLIRKSVCICLGSLRLQLWL